MVRIKFFTVRQIVKGVSVRVRLARVGSVEIFLLIVQTVRLIIQNIVHRVGQHARIGVLPDIRKAIAVRVLGFDGNR